MYNLDTQRLTGRMEQQTCASTLTHWPSMSSCWFSKRIGIDRKKTFYRSITFYQISTSWFWGISSSNISSKKMQHVECDLPFSHDSWQPCDLPCDILPICAKVALRALVVPRALCKPRSQPECRKLEHAWTIPKHRKLEGKIPRYSNLKTC